MNILSSIRERIGVVIAAVIAAIGFCICGALFTFYMAPRQALEASRISNLPMMDAQHVAAAQAGDDILITGALANNLPLFDDSALVAYSLSEWDVTPPSSDSDSADTDPTGSWRSVESVVPDLTLDMSGQPVQLLAASNAALSGPLHEELFYAEGGESAKYNGEWLSEGSLRYRGFYDGDLTTVLGKKAASGGVIPDKLYAGDRVAFEQSEADAAKGMLYAGICFMVLAPIVLVGGVLGAAFGRRRRRRFV